MVNLLKNVPNELIHEPWKLTYMEQKFINTSIGKDYPTPIVDNSKSSKIARDIIWKVKKSENSKIISKNVLDRHVSA